jgi:predicted ATPase
MIERITIKNFKSIRDLSLDLKSINILIGSNGVGKSNFIGFFSLVSNIFNKRLGAYTLELGGIDNLLYFGRKHSESIYGHLDFDNLVAIYFYIKPMTGNKGYIEAIGQYTNIDNSPNFSRNYENLFPLVWEKATEEYSGVDYSINNFDLNSLRVYHFHDTGKTSKMKQPCRINDNQYLREDGQNLAAHLYLLKEKHNPSFKRIEAIIRSVAPFFDTFDLKPDRLNPEMIQLEWKEKNSDMYFNGYNLSDGTLRMIALTTLLMQPEPPQIVILDEPELGLHPMAINKLSGMIQSASVNSQIIISTQSVNLVNNFEPEQVIVVDRQDEQSVFNRLSKEQLSLWLDEYSIGEMWQKNLIGGQP